MSVGIVVLAAGEAKRFGSAKLVVPIDGVPLVRRAALAALDVVARVVVVTGAHREAVEACVADLAVERVFNAGWADGMGGSIACGIAALGDCDAAIIALADQPLIGRNEFVELIAAHARAPGRIVAAQFDEVRGPPCLFPQQHFHELMKLHGEQGARAVLLQYADRVDAVPLSAAAVDVDTPEDFTPLRK
jgi:molybdenum cofactor cytidylyltransferase